MAGFSKMRRKDHRGRSNSPELLPGVAVVMFFSWPETLPSAHAGQRDTCNDAPLENGIQNQWRRSRECCRSHRQATLDIIATTQNCETYWKRQPGTVAHDYQ